MTHDWIIRELNDILDYARLNGLETLAERLDETLRLAEGELLRARRPTASAERALPAEAVR